MFQRTIARIRSIASGNEYDPKALSQIILVVAYDFLQTASDTIANDRASDATRGNEANTRQAGILHGRNAEH